MVHAYWLIGREIVEVEQRGGARARYGNQLLQRLAVELNQRYGRGFNVTGLKRMRQFYRAFPEGSALPVNLGGSEIGAAVRHQSPAHAQPLFPPILSWTHYRLLLTVERPDARSFYEIEAVRESWSVRELERQIASLLFERLSMSRDNNRLLRCFVLVDLKLGKLTHQDLGQMQMYVNFFDRFQRADRRRALQGVSSHGGRTAERVVATA